jgi:tight adherence protein C
MFELNGPTILIAACLLMGVSVGFGAFLVALQLKARGVSIDLAQETPSRRARDAEPTGLLALAQPFLPFFTALGRAFGLKSLKASLSHAYARAGYPGGLEDDDLVGLGLMCGIPLAIPVAIVFSAVSPLLAPVGLLIVVAGPGILSSSYSSQGNKREKSISRTMPFVLDLLVLTMRAGASLQQAVKRVADDHAGEPIGVEFSAVLTDLGTGLTNKEAFQNFHERVPIAPVRLFVDDLVQGEELGRPLADIFERQSDQSRIRRVQEATETAGKAKVLVLIPGMLVFIAVLILLFSPFFVRWYYGGLSVG